MSVRKRSWTTRSGEERFSFVVDYTDQHGKRHIETFKKKADAVAREGQVGVDVRKGIHVAPSNSMTVEQAGRKWLKEAKARDREAATIQGYTQLVDLHIVPRIGQIRVGKLTEQAVIDFRDSLLNGDEERGWAAVSPAMARKVMTGFKILLKQAKFAHVAADVKTAGSTRERRLEAGKNFPTLDEIKRLMAHAKTPRQKALLLTAVLTGLRASELRGLRWSDVNFNAAELEVRQRADRYRKIGPPKSNSGYRKIPMPHELISTLKEWKLACPISEEGLVFPSIKGRIDHNINLLRYLTPVMLAAGVVKVHRDRKTKQPKVNPKTGEAKTEPKYGMHSFRHFFASWCINGKDRGGRELPPKEVQVMLGHSKIAMTLDVYGHLFPAGSDRTELAESTRKLLG